MNGGPLETDYDVICECKGHLLHRHDRDMLVLDDCEFRGRMFRSATGLIVVEQPYGARKSKPEIDELIARARPSSSFRFDVEDHRLRLLVGAEAGRVDDGYGYSGIRVSPGKKLCNIYRPGGGLIVTLDPA